MAVADLAARAHFPNARVLPVGYRFPSRRVCHCYSSLYEIVGASDNLQPACDLANQDLYRSEKAVYCCQLFEVQCSKQYRMHEKPNTHRSNVSANTSRQTGRSNRFHSSFFRKLIAAESLKC